MLVDGTPAPSPQAGPAAEPSLMGAAFRQYNLVASAASSEILRERLFPSDPTPITTDELLDELDRNQLWGLEDHFLEVRTRGQFTAIKSQLEREQADREVLRDASLFAAIPAGLAAGILDAPTLLLAALPGGQLPLLGRLGTGIAATGVKYGTAAGTIAAGTEAGLHATQKLRTLDESLATVGGAVVLGGVLGSGAKFVTSGEAARVGARAKAALTDWLTGPNYSERLVTDARTAHDAINDVIAQRIAAGRKPTKKMEAEQNKTFDALTAAEERLQLYQDNARSTAGPLEWARTIGPRFVGQFSARYLDPIDFVFKRSNSAVAREAVQQIIEIPVLLNKNLKGQATPIAATTEIDPFIGAWATFRDKMLGGSLKEEVKRKAGFGDSFYAQARQAGFNGSAKEFDAAVDTAVRNGYVDPKGNAGVTKAAQSVKELLIDPIVREAKAAGIDVPATPMGAHGYAPRKYIVHKVSGADGQGTEFKSIVQQHRFDQLLAEARANLLAGQTLTPQQISGLRRSAKSFARESFKTITRGKIDEEGAFSSGFLAGGSPFAERVIPVPDIVLAQHGFIEQSITSLMDIFLRQAVPTIQMAKRFKTAAGKPDPSLEASVIPKLKAEYEQLAGVAKNAAEREAINAEGERVVSMVRNLRDAVMHTDRFNPRTRWHDTLNNSINVVKTYQVMRLMGNIGLSSLPDLANIIIRNGPGRFAQNVGQSFLKVAKLDGLNGTEVANEAKRLGAAVEWATNASMAANADLMSPLQGAATPVTRFVSKAARVYSISNFAVTWNDTMRRVAYRSMLDRILEASEKGWGNIAKSEQTFMAHLGLDQPAINRIGAAWRSQSEPLTDGFLRWATISDWGDTEAARLMAGALNKDVASTIIRPRTGDKALGFSNPLASLVFQFQSFLMSHALRTLTLSEQRLLANGPFSADALRIYTGVGSAVALGWFAEYLYALARDAHAPEEQRKHVQKLIENPGQHLARGIDRSAVLGLFGQGNNIWERLGGVGTTRTLQAAFEDESRQIEARGRWLDRDPLQTLMGPTLSQASDLIKFGVSVSKHTADDRDFTKKDARTLRETSPFQNHILFRGIFDEAQQRIGEDILGIAYD
ncbi:hypothetical protein [Hyphomicrobium sp. CS1BSMeth3]|uniref:hypothetical protein n=1 Tax=Hyphomicrobium sp. CS1BSMeth3 TaxID=1892844 RepID=UPI001160D898|nr:hypothetical protein [Hyphomicrobium sp. CS1BSMeth3]